MGKSEQQGSLPARSNQNPTSGFTIIELMIVMVIVAIGVALAVPTFRSITEKRHLTSAAESVASFMSLAQSAAVKYDRDVMVNLQRSNFNTWCIGATDGAVECDCRPPAEGGPNPGDDDYCDINGVPRRIQQSDVIPNANYQLLQSVLIDDSPSADANITFDPVRGTLLNLETVTFQMHTNTGSGSDKEYQLNVNLLPTGNVSICTATGRKLLLKMFPTCS